MKINYIPDEVFTKMTKKQRLALPDIGIHGLIKINGLLIIPQNKKINGYKSGAFFAKTEHGWFRSMDYDCWHFRNASLETQDTIDVRYSMLRGDFEMGGMHIFKIVNENHEAFLDWGGEITIRKK